MRLTHTQAVGLMVAVTLMWSIAGVVTRQLDNARSFEVTFWRGLFTAVSLVILLPLVQGPGLLGRMRRGGATLWLSGLCWSVMFTAFMLALTLTTVANVLITMAVAPLFTALVARLWIGYHIPARTWIAIALSATGIAFMYGAELTPAGLIGTATALAVPLASAVNWTLTQRARRHGLQVDLVPAVLIGAVLCAAATLPLALPFSASTRDLGWLAMLGLVQLAIPCSLAVLCARVLPAPEMSLLALLEVVFGILLAWLGAGETPASTVLVGGVLVLAALVGNEWWGWRGRK